jgi:hypothetical protein
MLLRDQLFGPRSPAHCLFAAAGFIVGVRDCARELSARPAGVDGAIG